MGLEAALACFVPSVCHAQIIGLGQPVAAKQPKGWLRLAGVLVWRVLLLRRPLSKTVRFNVLRVIPAGALQKKVFAQF